MRDNFRNLLPFSVYHFLSWLVFSAINKIISDYLGLVREVFPDVLLCVIPPIHRVYRHFIGTSLDGHASAPYRRALPSDDHPMPYPYFRHDPPVRTLTQILVSHFHDFATQHQFYFKKQCIRVE